MRGRHRHTPSQMALFRTHKVPRLFSGLFYFLYINYKYTINRSNIQVSLFDWNLSILRLLLRAYCLQYRRVVEADGDGRLQKSVEHVIVVATHLNQLLYLE